MVRDRRITKRRRRPPYPPPIDTLSYLELLDSAGYIAAMYLADEITEATYTQHGPELVVNGDFTDWTADDPDGWAVSEVGDATSNVTENPTGRCQIISTGTNAQITQTVLTVGDTYTVTGTATAVAAGRLKVRLGSEVGKIDGVGAFSITAIADGTAFTIARDSTPCDVTISNVSVKKNGFAGSILRNAAYTDGTGPELITNGDFADWTADDPDGWSVTEVGDATSDITENPTGQCQIISDGTNTLIAQTILTVGTTYKIIIEVTDVSAGKIQIQDAAEVIQIIETTGTHIFYHIAKNAALQIKRWVGATDVTIDNVSVKKVGHLDAALTATTWGASGGLIYDGATSLATVANHADLAGLTSQAWAFLATADSYGESSFGSWFIWGAGGVNEHISIFRDGDGVDITIKTDTVNSQYVSTLASVDFIGSPALISSDFDDDNVLGNGRRGRVHRGLGGSLALLASTIDTAATGTVATPTTDLILGNNAAASLTFDGTFWKIIIFNATALPFIDGINAILTILAGV